MVVRTSKPGTLTQQAIILAIAILLWVWHPVMLLQKSGSSNRKK